MTYGYIPHNARHQEWIVMWTMGLGWLWHANVGSSLVVNGSFWWGMFIVGEATGVWGQKVCWKSAYLPLILLILWTWNCSKIFLIHWVWIKSRNNNHIPNMDVKSIWWMCEWAVLIFKKDCTASSLSQKTVLVASKIFMRKRKDGSLPLKHHH